MKPYIDLVIYKVIINNLNNFLLYKKKVISKNLIHMTIKNVKSIKYL